MAKGLTPKQRRFVEAYCGEAKGNGLQAARLAGYRGNDKTLQVVAHNNIRKHIVAVEIEKLSKKETARAIISREEVMALLADIATNTENETARDRVKAMDVLNKMRGEYIQRHEVSVRNMTEKDRKERVKVLLAQVVEHDS